MVDCLRLLISLAHWPFSGSLLFLWINQLNVLLPAAGREVNYAKAVWSRIRQEMTGEKLCWLSTNRAEYPEGKLTKKLTNAI